LKKKNIKPHTSIYFKEHYNPLINYLTRWDNLWQTNLTSSVQKLYKNFFINNTTNPKLLTTLDLKQTHLLVSILTFNHMYSVLQHRTLFRFSLFLKNINKINTTNNNYYLYLNFRSNKLYINLLGNSSKNYLTLSVGLFLKFFKNKKSFKKNKIIKLLLMKFLRKIFLISGIKHVYIYVKKTPLFFQELCKTLTSQLITPFFNPISKSFLFDNPKTSTPLYIKYILFLNSKPYSFMKKARFGRLKRKVMRRIIRTNRMSD
jgi:hypothetical protein